MRYPIARWAVGRGHRRQLTGASEKVKAVRLLGARDLRQAKSLAEKELRDAENSRTCRNPLAIIFEQIGLTLFLDDDPEQLILAFKPGDHDGVTPRILAACIVLFGRSRVAAPVPV